VPARARTLTRATGLNAPRAVRAPSPSDRVNIAAVKGSPVQTRSSQRSLQLHSQAWTCHRPGDRSPPGHGPVLHRHRARPSSTRSAGAVYRIRWQPCIRGHDPSPTMSISATAAPCTRRQIADFALCGGRDPPVGGVLRSSRYARRPNPGGAAGLVCGASGSYWPAWVMWSSTLRWQAAAAGTGRERGGYAGAWRQDLPAGGCRFAGRCPLCGARWWRPSVLLSQCGGRGLLVILCCSSDA
jgi:hypothetical protein